MKPAALDLEGGFETEAFSRRSFIGALPPQPIPPYSVKQQMRVPKPTKSVLHPLEKRDAGGRRPLTGVGRDLHCVSQFLDANADAVQALGVGGGTCLTNCRAESGGPVNEAPVHPSHKPPGPAG